MLRLRSVIHVGRRQRSRCLQLTISAASPPVTDVCAGAFCCAGWCTCVCALNDRKHNALKNKEVPRPQRRLQLSAHLLHQPQVCSCCALCWRSVVGRACMSRWRVLGDGRCVLWCGVREREHRCRWCVEGQHMPLAHGTGHPTPGAEFRVWDVRWRRRRERFERVAAAARRC